ncbi:MAG: hypothetical protein KF813_10820 [Trueperaceae bacterium]|nr:hypothetical protein [Trueperaceae bacterium]
MTPNSGAPVREPVTPAPWLGVPALVFGCLMLGIVLATIGINLRPEAHTFLAKLVCDGDVMFSVSTLTGVPAGQATDINVYCADPAGLMVRITNVTLVILAPLFYTLVAAVVLVPLWLVARRRRAQR